MLTCGTRSECAGQATSRHHRPHCQPEVTGLWLLPAHVHATKHICLKIHFAHGLVPSLRCQLVHLSTHACSQRLLNTHRTVACYGSRLCTTTLIKSNLHSAHSFYRFAAYVTAQLVLLFSAKACNWTHGLHLRTASTCRCKSWLLRTSTTPYPHVPPVSLPLARNVAHPVRMLKA